MHPITALMQKHDWFYEYSDDPKAWRKGLSEKIEIMAYLMLLPEEIALTLIIENAPLKLRDLWLRSYKGHKEDEQSPKNK